MRNATSIFLFGASALGFTFLGACGGGGDGDRTGTAGAATMTAAGASVVTVAGAPAATAGAPGTAGTPTGTAGSATAGTGTGGSGTCSMTAAMKHGDGTTKVLDEIDDADTKFAPAGMAAGSWDFSKDASTGTINPANTTALAPVDGGHAGKGLHITGMGLTGWGASLGAFLNGPMGAYDASSYGGVAFWIKGKTDVQEGMNKVMIQARMPDVLPGAGSCCNDKVMGMECYSGHRLVIDVPADWTEVRIPWTEFKGPAWGLGSTMPLDPNRIRDINFSFNHDAMDTKGTGASFDVWVDGLRFMDKTEMGSVTGGGGAPSGTSGAGGAATAGGGAGGSGGA